MFQLEPAKNCLLTRFWGITLAHRAAIAPPYRGSSEHVIGSEDRRRFRERCQGCGRCCGTLRQACRRRTFGQCCLREGCIRHQIHLKKKNKVVESGKHQFNYKQNNIYFNWRRQSWQVLTGWAAGLGSEDLRWAIIACSRSLSFFNCVRWEDRNRSWELVNSRIIRNDEITSNVGTTSFLASWEV